jgi:hypothetical protein
MGLISPPAPRLIDSPDAAAAAALADKASAHTTATTLTLTFEGADTPVCCVRKLSFLVSVHALLSC